MALNTASSTLGSTAGRVSVLELACSGIDTIVGEAVGGTVVALHGDSLDSGEGTLAEHAVACMAYHDGAVQSSEGQLVGREVSPVHDCSLWKL